MEKRLKLYIPYNLQFFGKDGPGGEKTEEPTSKKLGDARKDGQVAKSMELIMAVALLSLFITLKACVGFIGTHFMENYHIVYSSIADLVKSDFDVRVGVKLMNSTIVSILTIALPIFATGVITAFLANYVQIKWKVTTKPLQPKFSKLNPIKGFKRIVSMEKLFELLKSIFKIGIISMVVYNALKDQWNNILLLYDMELFSAIEYIGTTIIDLGLKISELFLLVGFADLFYQKKKFKKDMKMSKQEIKDEYKNSEGDPQVKGQIRAKMREAAQRRMMQELPKADVVITNPTHLAVALKYDKDNSAAPILIAKGADFLAAKIKDIARENKIEIVENKPLARMIYYNVDIGTEIPQELYQAVAEVLAYVYNLKNN